MKTEEQIRNEIDIHKATIIDLEDLLESDCPIVEISDYMNMHEVRKDILDSQSKIVALKWVLGESIDKAKIVKS
jgi:hypothetical protein